MRPFCSKTSGVPPSDLGEMNSQLLVLLCIGKAARVYVDIV